MTERDEALNKDTFNVNITDLSSFFAERIHLADLYNLFRSGDLAGSGVIFSQN